MSRKTRSDSMLDKLPAHQQAALATWLFEENISYDAARARLFEDFAVRVSRAALFSWRQRKAQERLIDRVQEKMIIGAQAANAMISEAESNPAPFQRAMLEFMVRIAIQRATDAGEPLTTAEMLDLVEVSLAGRKDEREDVKLKLSQEKIGLEERKVKLLERKASDRDEAAKTLQDSALTPAEQQQRIRQIFGLA